MLVMSPILINALQFVIRVAADLLLIETCVLMHWDPDNALHKLEHLGILLLLLVERDELFPENMRHKVQSNAFCSALEESRRIK